MPLKPVGMLAANEVRSAAICALSNMAPARLSSLRGSFDDQVIVVLGEEAMLPWVPGGIYLGQESHAPGLFIPTLLKPNLPVDWLERAVQSKYGQGHYAIDPWRHAVYNLSHALTISPERLREIG